jgi:hypothetical protein
MSDLDLQTFADDLPLHLPADTLKQHIRSLIRRYVHRRSPQLAQQVARYSEALALHPAVRDAPDELSAFCRLKWHWRLLAAQGSATAAA